MQNCCLLTGGTGFIGSHVCDFLLGHTDYRIKILDRLDCTSTIDRLQAIDGWERLKNRVEFIWWDLRAPINTYTEHKLLEVNYVIHLAGSTHVDRSIEDPLSFVMDNVVGTTNLLNFMRNLRSLKRGVMTSTDEVFGSSQGHHYTEIEKTRPENPYAGTKAGLEGMTHAFACTYKMPLTIIRPMNVFGSRQHPEKFIPSTIKKVYLNQEVIIHADETQTIPGARSYIAARNVASAIHFILERGEIVNKENREEGIYHIVGEREVDNLDLAKLIADYMRKPLKYKLVDFHSSRPGHDRLYRQSGVKLRKLGWEVSPDFEESLRNTVKWYLENPAWMGL